jgi:hypothetical protein
MLRTNGFGQTAPSAAEIDWAREVLAASLAANQPAKQTFGDVLSAVAARDLLKRVKRHRDDMLVAVASADAGEDVPGRCGISA